MMIGLKDVARAAGVSVSTVSRVITGSPLVNAETRANVQHAMDSLQYRPSRVARRLRRDSARANLIGLIVPDIQNPFFAENCFRATWDLYRQYVEAFSTATTPASAAGDPIRCARSALPKTPDCSKHR